MYICLSKYSAVVFVGNAVLMFIDYDMVYIFGDFFNVCWCVTQNLQKIIILSTNNYCLDTKNTIQNFWQKKNNSINQSLKFCLNWTFKMSAYYKF